jgi:hypothetical protein
LHPPETLHRREAASSVQGDQQVAVIPVVFLPNANLVAELP